MNIRFFQRVSFSFCRFEICRKAFCNDHAGLYEILYVVIKWKENDIICYLKNHWDNWNPNALKRGI